MSSDTHTANRKLNVISYVGMLSGGMVVGSLGPLLVGFTLNLTGQWYLVYLPIAFLSVPLPFFFLRKKLYQDISFQEDFSAHESSKKPVGNLFF